MKKVMALLLSLVMVLAMSVVAFATEEGSTTSGTYTITAPATSHQYERECGQFLDLMSKDVRRKK